MLANAIVINYIYSKVVGKLVPDNVVNWLLIKINLENKETLKQKYTCQILHLGLKVFFISKNYKYSSGEDTLAFFENSYHYKNCIELENLEISFKKASQNFEKNTCK